MENYNNIILISADRNGSTAFQETLKVGGLNGDSQIFLGECFSQDPAKNQPPQWYDPTAATPKDMIETVNKVTGKPVLLKIQITYQNFTKDYLEIVAKRKIFLHRNLFDSTLSRCIAQKTGKWHTFQNETINNKSITIPVDFFISRLEWRIEQYQEHLLSVLDWCNECYRYENYTYKNNLPIVTNVDKKSIVHNYNQLLDIFLSYNQVTDIENSVTTKIKKLK